MNFFKFLLSQAKSVLFPFFCLITMIFNAYGQNDRTIISGRLDNWIAGVTDTPEIVIYDKYKDKDFIKNNRTYKFSMVEDSFYVSIKSPEKMFYVGFKNFFNSNKNILDDAKYLIESGNRILFSFDSNNKSQVKTDNHLLNSQFELLSDNNIVSNSHLYDRSYGDRHEFYFREMREQREKAKRVLASYREDLTPFQYELIKINYLGFIDSMVWWRMGVMVKSRRIQIEKYSDIHERMVSIYENIKSIPEDSIIKASNTYLEAHVNYNWAIGYMYAGIQEAPEQWFMEMYKNIKNNYSGILRDRLLVVALKNFNVFLSNPELIEYINDALIFNEDMDSKAELLTIFESIKPGTMVQYFEFNTRDGTKVSLDDFKGKAIVAHFWSLGCVPCITMTKNIHPLIDKYGDNPNIAFLNINVNSSKKHWDNGLSSNLYSHEKEFLLNVGEIGTKHSLLKYYSYYGVPQLMLIDRNGNLITSNAPRARNEKEFDELEGMIIDAL